MKKLPLVTLIVTILFREINFGQTPPVPRISASIVNQPSSPLQITAVKRTLADQIAAITVKNTSNKIVSEMQIAWVVAAPTNCAASPLTPTFGVAPPDRVRLVPGSTVTTKDYRVLTENLLQTSHQGAISLLVVEITIQRATFEDGSSWTSSFRPNEIFNPSVLEALGKQCKAGKLVSIGSKCTGRGTSMTELSADPTILPRCWYRCVGDPGAAQICENHVTSCTIKICSRDGCPGQVCDLYCPEAPTQMN